jgi:hypothetical protein
MLLEGSAGHAAAGPSLEGAALHAGLALCAAACSVWGVHTASDLQEGGGSRQMKCCEVEVASALNVLGGVKAACALGSQAVLTGHTQV